MMIEHKLSDTDRSILLHGIARIVNDAVVNMFDVVNSEDIPRLKLIIQDYDACRRLEHVIKHAVSVMSPD